MSTIDPNALSSALPAGIEYPVSGVETWDAIHIAEFQAERLAESGYVLHLQVHEIPHEHEWIDVTQVSDPSNERRYVCNGCPLTQVTREVQ